MRLKFSRIERMTGLFVLTAFGGLALTAGGVLVKRRFFEPRTIYHTTVPSASGLRSGTPVLISGVKAGAVDDVSLGEDGRVHVTLYIVRSYTPFVTAGARLRTVRPTIVGDRIFELSVAEPDPMGRRAPALAEGAEITVDGGSDLADWLGPAGGAKLARLADTIDALARESLSLVRQAGGQNNVQRLTENLRVTSDSLRKLLPTVVDHGPTMTRDLSVIIANLSQLTSELNRLAPLLSETARAVPAGTQKTLELLTETVTLVRGMQRSFLFRGGVSDVREEDDRRAREPAGAK